MGAAAEAHANQFSEVLQVGNRFVNRSFKGYHDSVRFFSPGTFSCVNPTTIGSVHVHNFGGEELGSRFS